MADSAPGTQVVSAPRAMTPRRSGRYGPFARWLLRKLFGPVPFPPDAVAPLQKLAQEATLVYVLRSSSLLHLLFFNWKFSSLGLPIARAATGLGYRIFAPFARWYLGGPQAASVEDAISRGESALVFLRQPRTLPSAIAALHDPFPAVIKLQKESQKPIALVLLTLVWRKRPKQLRRTLRDV